MASLLRRKQQQHTPCGKVQVRPTSEGKEVEKRHRNQSVAMMVMSQPSFSRCWRKRGSLASTSS